MNDYPLDWKLIAHRIKEAAGWKCERCSHANDVLTGHVLTVHHLDGDKANCEDWNLAALCQRCHLKIQGRVKIDQLFMLEILDVSPWFKPHLEGYLKSLSPRPQVVSTNKTRRDRHPGKTKQTRPPASCEARKAGENLWAT